MVISGMCERKTHQGLSSCYIFSRNLHVFLLLYYTGLKGKHLSCPAFNKFHTKEMRLLFDKEKPLGRVLLDFWGSFSGCPNWYTSSKSSLDMALDQKIGNGYPKRKIFNKQSLKYLLNIMSSRSHFKRYVEKFPTLKVIFVI